MNKTELVKAIEHLQEQIDTAIATGEQQALIDELQYQLDQLEIELGQLEQ